MFYILLALSGLCMLYVVISLISGGVSMTRTGEGSREKSNSWMWKRVYGQGAALLFFMAAFWVKRNGG